MWQERGILEIMQSKFAIGLYVTMDVEMICYRNDE